MGCNQSRHHRKAHRVREQHAAALLTLENKSMCPYLNGLKREVQEARAIEPKDSFNVLVESANGLRKADRFSQSDSFVRLRVGSSGSDYDSKPEVTESVSHMVQNDNNPAFKWGCRIPFDSPSDEVHIQVLDNDLFSGDDFLGELRISVAELQAQTKDDFHTFTLLQKDGSEMKPAGSAKPSSLTFLSGKRVKHIVLENVPTHGAFHEINAWAQSVKSVWEQDQLGGEFVYWKNMAQFALAGKASDCNGMKRYFDARCGDDKIWRTGYFPRNSSVHVGYTDVRSKLEKLGEELGTNNTNGSVYRDNFLGIQKLTGVNWPELQEAGYKPGIGLCADQETHGWVRPLIVALVGPEGNWNKEFVRERAREFWATRTERVTSSDFGVYVTRILHKVHFDMDLSEEDGKEFMQLQFFLLITNALFEFAHKSDFITRKLKWKDNLAKKAKWIAKYKAALVKMPQIQERVKALTPNEVTCVASMLFDSVAFAGGAGVPRALSQAIALPYTKFGHKHFPGGKNFKLTKQNYKVYIQETMRRFPPVGTFTQTRRNYSGDGRPDQLEFLAVGRAHNDPDVFGDKEFVMRPMKEYEQKSFPFLDFMNFPNVESPNSHSCPGKVLATTILYETIEAWIDTCGGKHLDLSQWPLHVEDGKEPKPLGMSEYGPSPYTLDRKTKK